MNKLKIATTVTRATTLALRLRGQRMLPTYVKVVSSQLHTKQAAAFEESFVSKVSPIFRKQIESAVSKLRALSDMQVFTAAGLRDKIFNPADWNEELIQRALPVIAGAMSTSTVATLQQVMHGIQIYKSWTPSEKRAAKPAGAPAVGSGTNCGIGPNGFQPGNTCARGDGGSSSGGGQAVNTDQQSVKPRGISSVWSEEKLEVPRVRTGSTRPSVGDGMTYLGKLSGLDINLNNPDLADSSVHKVARALADDVLFAYENTKHEGGWYSSDIRKTYELVAKPHAKNPAGHPELSHDFVAKTPQEAQDAESSKFIFAACLALSSPGEDVLINGRNAEFLYRQWKNSHEDIEQRTFKGATEFSKSQKALPDQLQMLEDLFDSKRKVVDADGNTLWERRGIPGVAKLMNLTVTNREVREMGLEIFHPELVGKKMTAKELTRLGRVKYKSEVMDSKLPVFSIFGPKLGAFFSNIRGNMAPVTIDLWETRHLSALSGRPLRKMSKKSLENAVVRFDANRADIDQQLKTHGVDKAQFDRELDLMRDPHRQQPDPNGAIADWVIKQQRVYEKTQDLNHKPKPLKSYADKTEANKLANGMLKNLSGVKDAPYSAEKRNIRRVFVVATEMVRADPRYKDATPAEIQAVSWSFIQRALQRTGVSVDIDRRDPATRELIAKTFSNSIQRLLNGQTHSFYNWDHKALADKAGESRSHTNRALKKAANAAKKGESDAAALQRAAEAMQAKTLKLEDDLQRMENRLEREYKKRTGNKSAGSVFVGGFAADRDDDIYDEYGEKEFSVEYDVEQIRWNYDRSKIADPTEQVLQLLEYLERRETGLAPEKLSKVFCPTGPGGGVDPTCKPGCPTRVLFEAAPDPNNKQLHARWNALPTHVKQEISHKIVKEILPKVLKAAGVHAQIKDQFGGYMDDSNPSFAVCVPNNVKAEKVLQIARMAGFALSQDSVMVVGANEFEGSAAAGLVTLTLPKGLSLEQTHEVYKKLRTIDKGEAVAGHTTIDGHMMVVDFKGDGHGLAQKITDVTQRQYAIMVASGYVAFPEKKDYDYGQGTDTGIPEHHGGSASVAAERRNAGLARTAASAIIEQEIARYEQGRNTRGAETSIATGQLGFTKVFCPTGVGGGVDPTCKPGSGGVGGVSGRHEQTPAGGQGTAPLTGLPQKPITIPGYGVVHPGPHQAARDAAEKYMKRAGLPYDPPTAYVKVDKERAERVAAEYDQMKHDPEDPEVKAAYAAMIKETLAQYQVMKEAGVLILFNEPGENPYPNPRMATEDVRNNNRLYVFPTLDGFGSDASVDISNSPLLADSGETFGGKPATVNDIFRAVHDYFGHIKEGVGFRADGEENAWRSHSAMYSPLARRAMTSETRGQNSWLNYGPYGETNRTAKVEDTHFADQKTGLMPEWVALEGAKSFTGEYYGRSDEVRNKFNGATNEAPGTSGASGLSRRGAMGGSGRGLESFDSTSVGIGRAGSTKTSTATEWLDRLDEDDVDLEDIVYRTPYGPVAMSIATEYPVWMKFLLRENIEETFYQPYWETINETTGGDIEAVLERGMLDGYSINDMAKEIEEKFGSEEYPLSRGRNIARTEVGNALNATRSEVIDTMIEDLGMQAVIKKVWHSVLGNTTRDTHANIDGVPADKDGCWALGGIRCRWPGDPMLSAKERCNCQCTIVTEFGMQDDEAQELIAEHQLRQLQEGKSVLTWDRKNCGTGGGGFKPGNSCARGGGGSVEELRAKAVDFFHEQLTEHFNNAPGVRVTREQAQHYTEEAKSCFDQMSAKSLGKFLAHVKQIKFYANTEDVTRALADNAEEILKTRSRVLGAFQRYDQDEPYGTLHLDGSYELRTTRAVYAHEFGHTIDWTINSRGKGSRISDSTEWIHAQWKELSLRQLSAYAAVSPAEGFAEAHRRLLGDAGNIDAFPLCKEVFEKHGII